MLDAILLKKQQEVAVLKNSIEKDPESKLAQCFRIEFKRSHPSGFKKALQKKGLSVIAEIKRKSPSKGWLSDIRNPIELAESYESGGASALSILTDETFFGGSLRDLEEVRKNIELPILRKDFVLDEIQIAEAFMANADAVLLIVSVLKEKVKGLLEYAHELGMDALVEVHHLDELKLAIEAGAKIIGINHRDLSTFQMNMKLGEELVNHIPNHILKVAESGIHSAMDAKNLYEAGFDAVLIGEALVKAEDPALFISQCG